MKQKDLSDFYEKNPLPNVQKRNIFSGKNGIEIYEGTIDQNMRLNPYLNMRINR